MKNRKGEGKKKEAEKKIKIKRFGSHEPKGEKKKNTKSFEGEEYFFIIKKINPFFGERTRKQFK